MSLNFLVNCPLSLSSLPSSPPPPCRPLNWKPSLSFSSFARPRVHARGGLRVGAFLFDPTRDPILKDALKLWMGMCLKKIVQGGFSLATPFPPGAPIKEPIAFVGGMFAGLLRLDLNEDPLREWIARTAEAAGITEEEAGNGDIQSEEFPQQIKIE